MQHSWGMNTGAWSDCAQLHSQDMVGKFACWSTLSVSHLFITANTSESVKSALITVGLSPSNLPLVMSIGAKLVSSVNSSPASTNAKMKNKTGTTI